MGNLGLLSEQVFYYPHLGAGLKAGVAGLKLCSHSSNAGLTSGVGRLYWAHASICRVV